MYRGYFIPARIDGYGLNAATTSRCNEECSVADFKVVYGAPGLKNRADGTWSVDVDITIDAEFNEPCHCCEYRQYMVGRRVFQRRIRTLDEIQPPIWVNVPVENPISHAPPPTGIYPVPTMLPGMIPVPFLPINRGAYFVEDCRYYPDTGWECYGRKDQPAYDWDSYSADGCSYHGEDAPGHVDIFDFVQNRRFGSFVEYKVKIYFLHQIVDTCNDNRVVMSKNGSVDFELPVRKQDFF